VKGKDLMQAFAQTENPVVARLTLGAQKKFVTRICPVKGCTQSAYKIAILREGSTWAGGRGQEKGDDARPPSMGEATSSEDP